MEKEVRNEYVKISSIGLEKLVKDTIQLKQFLSKVLSVNNMSMLHKKIHSLEQEVAKLKQEIQIKVTEDFILRRRHSDNLADVEKLREENFQLRTQLNVLQEERSEEYEEFLSFVTICLTIIWHVSLKDECVEAMIARQTIVKFLEFVSHSLRSFSDTNKSDSQENVDNVHFDSNSQEYTLVLSIAGIMTNIAATPLGRDYLSSKEPGLEGINALILYLSETPAQQCTTVKSLILKALYNVSINKAGLKYLTSKKDLMTTLAYVLKDETDADLRLSCINCIQSLITEPDNPSLAHELIEVVSTRKLQEYADLSKGELKKLTLELISDLTEVLNYRRSQP